MKLFKEGLVEICKQILRPVRAQYSQFDLGPNNIFNRLDRDIVNHKNQIIKVSIYQGSQNATNCMIYLHSLNGSRLEIYKHIQDILRENYFLVTFDFSGSGRSQGELVTYGHNEMHDLHAVITQLCLKNIIIWGRSMGSVVALLYMQQYQNQNVLAMILDSPFSSLQDIVIHMAQKRTRLPNFILKSLTSYVSETMTQMGGFALEDINCVTHIENVLCPAFFITSKLDTVVPWPKIIHYTQEDHNSVRDPRLINQILQWIKKKVPLCDRIGVGTQIKQKIMQQVPIKQIDLNIHRGRSIREDPNIIKERSTTLDQKNSKVSLSPKNRIQRRYNDMLQTQRSLYIDRSLSINKDEYNSNKPKQLSYFLK